jgi:predicted KAP-like P-loop ATPase
MATVGDNPIKSGVDDRLQRLDSVKSLVSDIRDVDASEGYVVGIVGSWGSGKTSIVNMIREELEQEPAIPIIDFNPWFFSGTNELVESFFRELAAQMRLKGDRLAKIANTVDMYGGLLSPVSAIPYVGAWFDRLRGAAKVIKEFQDKRKGSINVQREELSTELAGLETPIVVIVDDIDRLEISEIRDIFKLVRLTASFPNVIYVLAFDRERVEEALSQSGFDGRVYLEKIVQLGVDVPSVPDVVMLRQIGQALEGALNDLDLPERFDEQAWPDVLMEIVRPLIKSMRDVRRYAAAVRSKARALGGQIELVDVMALEAIRIFLPDVFRAVVDGPRRSYHAIRRFRLALRRSSVKTAGAKNCRRWFCPSDCCQSAFRPHLPSCAAAYRGR